ncbi:tail fiber assembly protein [Escherichia coli]|uniref:tail fiber assembly protein n=1 Tax=Escherichia coli TaxID=562 RepID=UPI00140A0C47|nr:tail fiber assembly protein [Escherichia coli]MDC9043104.1 tail fiber assembly protein [Escherichia coli]NHR59496.1 tail fiber assembly protein [Escherichia coli]
MKCALIKSNQVINIIEIDEGGINEFTGGQLILIPEGEVVDIGFSVDGDAFIPPPIPELTDDEIKQLNESKRKEKVAIAVNYISQNSLDSKLMLGMLSDEDKRKYAQIITYIDDLNSMTLGSFSDVTWPKQPF